MLLTAVTATVALAACGSPSGGEAPPASGGQADGAFPVTVEHAYGSTEIPAAPKRVITLGYTDPDPLLAVGVAPIGIVNWFLTPPPNNKWPWQEAGYGATVPEEVGKRDEYNLEKIAALQPDLIIAGYSGMTQAQYDQVSKIAPTVAQPKDYEQFTAPWQVLTRHITKAVGQEQRGNELVTQTEARIAQVKSAHPEWAQQTAAVMQFQAPDYRVFSKGDLKADLMSALGFQAPPEVTQLAAGKSDASVSPERVDLLNVDKLLVFARNPQVQAEISARPEFAALPVAQQKRVRFLSTTEPTSAAISYGSPISFPYALDKLVPLLEGIPAPTQ
ncbi:iron-siderophore ABC transporter substrate-binding protein [Pseudonocardia sp. KRD291]|uniref:ABC transporter substrate-binding protein n=1 Tax=Pseudonocardia sp. KRD291 TaxID=2792007 RepID=UPI001C4A6842|nr:iron-siderophore ABC transporter substrate-binding protein [Pseudonocardia sp. KRD291]MBW0101278.1 iron-siderophore ABC transporter substrate-binding protein [Pseudonocardia sp. KRD291]